jgi:leucyl aminopeptidase
VALFLEEFVDGHPWAHIDIAGTAQLEAVAPAGQSGFLGRIERIGNKIDG